VKVVVQSAAKLFFSRASNHRIHIGALETWFSM